MLRDKTMEDKLINTTTYYNFIKSPPYPYSLISKMNDEHPNTDIIIKAVNNPNFTTMDLLVLVNLLCKHAHGHVLILTL